MQDRLIIKLWHTNRKCFIEQFSILQTINSDGNFEHTYFEYNPNTKELERLSTCHIKEIRCNGLKDKNVKLIYEGDVVHKKGTKNWKKEKLLSKVIWGNDSAAFMISDENGLHQMPLNSNNIEVLGNIYENPELLERRMQ